MPPFVCPDIDHPLDKLVEEKDNELQLYKTRFAREEELTDSLAHSLDTIYEEANKVVGVVITNLGDKVFRPGRAKHLAEVAEAKG